MKRSIIALLLIISFIIPLVSCGEYKPPVNPNDSNTNDRPSDGDTDAPGGDSNGEDDKSLFTVTVMLEGKAYSPAAELDMKVRWTNATSSHTAPVSAEGVAVMSDLDGDYSVSLINIPDGYTYNPNIYKATNDKRSVRIELVRLTTVFGTGEGLYNCMKLNRTGSYRANISSAGKIVYYEFSPRKAGVYKVESIIDVSANMYNPVLKVYNGTSAAKFELTEVDGGGAVSTYTKNFLYTLDIPDEYLGNTYTFAIRVEGKDATYPTYVDFTLSYAGVAEDIEHANSQMMIPEYIPSNLNYFDMVMYETLHESHLTEEDLNNPTYKWFKEYWKYLSENKNTFGNSWTDAAERVDGKKVFNQDGFRLNETDGYYHVYDEVKYAATGGYGPILYANIGQGCYCLEISLSEIEHSGNKTLTVCDGTENYKLFIEGSYELTLPHGDSGPYLCNSTCRCYKTYKTAKDAFDTAIAKYKAALKSGAADIQKYIKDIRTAKGNLMSTNGGVCDSNCNNCNADCRHLPDENKFRLGYDNIATKNDPDTTADDADAGRVPVTEELKIFLQKLSESQRYFSDGNGYAEVDGYTAFEDSQWLFACGYYK